MITVHDKDLTTYEAAGGSSIQIANENPASPADIYITTGEDGASLTKAEVFEFIVALAVKAGLSPNDFTDLGVFITSPQGSASVNTLLQDLDKA